MSNLKKRFEELGGVGGVNDIADFFEVTRGEVRDWAATNDLPKVGNSYAFVIQHALDFEADLDADACDPGDPDDDDEDEDEEPEEGDRCDDD